MDLCVIPPKNDICDKSIAIFGMSGNPPTGDQGHTGIVRYLSSTGNFDEIWILPVYYHQYSSKRNLESYDNRMNMCSLSFLPISSPECIVRVLRLEKQVYETISSIDSNAKHGTIDTLSYIRSYVDGNITLHLVLGADSYNDICLGKWKEGDRYCI
jgi:nicotinic acid mononucleotide adenylyltransferase